MTPVVNGLRNEFNGRAEFVILNAGFGEGKEAFDAYQLPGHPSYVLLDPSGEVMWLAFGPQARSTLEDALNDALETLISN